MSGAAPGSEGKGGRQSLYAVLGLDKSASQAEIKKAYHALALQLHPDKNPAAEREAANENFRSLQRVYSILGDVEKRYDSSSLFACLSKRRKVYDDTGDEGDGLSGEQFDSLYKFYRGVKVTVEDIAAHERAYRGSAEETRELKELYTRFGGNMDSVFNWLCCSRPELDSHRFMTTLEEAVSAGELKKTSRFEKWAKVVARRPVPKNALGEAGAGGEDDSSKALVAAIQARRGQQQSFLEQLEAKYAAGGQEEEGGGKRTRRRR